MEREPMTVLGKQRLEEELKHLKSVERPSIINAIAEARAHGDLKENAEYHAAKEQQGFTEGRIAEIESKLARAQVIDISKMLNNDKVIFGATIELLNTDTEETIIYKIVGDDESDLAQGKISYKAPIARALIGKHVDDGVEFKAPNGMQHYEIVSVRYE